VSRAAAGQARRGAGSARRVTFLQNVVRARGFLAECLRRRGIDLAVELS
jgi:hypothetical protein